MQPPSNRLPLQHGNQHQLMKSLIKRFVTTALALSATALTIPESRAADVRLEGYGDYLLNENEDFFPRAPKQSGRYRNLDRDYYHKVNIRMEYISNLSRARSGSLSFELWAMPYYGATSGIVLMTRGIDPLRGDRSYEDVSRTGYAISLGADRFPELSLWEYTRRGWVNRDHLTFEDRDYL